MRSCSHRMSPAQHGMVTALSLGWLDPWVSKGSGCCPKPLSSIGLRVRWSLEGLLRATELG